MLTSIKALGDRIGNLDPELDFQGRARQRARPFLFPFSAYNPVRDIRKTFIFIKIFISILYYFNQITLWLPISNGIQSFHDF